MDRERAAEQAADLIQAVWRVREQWAAAVNPLIAGLARDLDRTMDEFARLEVLLRHGAPALGPEGGH